MLQGRLYEAMLKVLNTCTVKRDMCPLCAQQIVHLSKSICFSPTTAHAQHAMRCCSCTDVHVGTAPDGCPAVPASHYAQSHTKQDHTEYVDFTTFQTVLHVCKLTLSLQKKKKTKA